MRFPRPVIRLFGRVHTPLYRLSGGRIGRRVGGAEVALLTTTGRRSGLRRTAPLLVVSEAEHHVVVASQGGHDHHPAWYLNLKADPRAVLQIGNEQFVAFAADADESERERLWPRLVEAYPAWEEYRSRTDRRFPIVILRRDPPAS